MIITNQAFTNIHKGTNMKNTPYFQLHFSIYGCGYQLRINDVPVNQDFDGTGVTATIPVSEWIKPGKNTLSIQLTPSANANELAKLDQKCTAQAELKMKDSNQKESFTITQINYESKANNFNIPSNGILLNSLNRDKLNNHYFSQNKIISNKPISIKKIKSDDYGDGVIISQNIELNIPYPKWIWLNSDSIENTTQTKNNLLKEYQNIWSNIDQQNFQQLSDNLKIRRSELASAYNMDEKKFSIINTLKDLKQSSEEKLVSIVPKYVTLDIFANGKLAKLSATGDDGPIIFFDGTHNTGSHSFDFIFAKIHNKWVVVR